MECALNVRTSNRGPHLVYALDHESIDHSQDNETHQEVGSNHESKGHYQLSHISDKHHSVLERGRDRVSNYENLLVLYLVSAICKWNHISERWNAPTAAVLHPTEQLSVPRNSTKQQHHNHHWQ